MPDFNAHQYSLYVTNYIFSGSFKEEISRKVSQDGWTLLNEPKRLPNINSLQSYLLHLSHPQHKLTDAQNYARNLSLFYKADIFAESYSQQSKEIQLLALDMDSTLIEQEVIDELARQYKIEDKISLITEQAMRGEIDFCESFRQRVGLLKGLSEQAFNAIRNSISFSPGVKTLLTKARDHQCKVFVLSGGFTRVGNYLKSQVPIDGIIANDVEIIDQKLTGNVKGEIIDANAKAYHLERLASEYSIPNSNISAVGDGANDLFMLNKAEFGIAYKAKPIVRKQAQYAINYTGLDSLCYLFNWYDQ